MNFIKLTNTDGLEVTIARDAIEAFEQTDDVTGPATTTVFTRSGKKFGPFAETPDEIWASANTTLGGNSHQHRDAQQNQQEQPQTRRHTEGRRSNAV